MSIASTRSAEDRGYTRIGGAKFPFINLDESLDGLDLGLTVPR